MAEHIGQIDWATLMGCDGCGKYQPGTVDVLRWVSAKDMYDSFRVDPPGTIVIKSGYLFCPECWAKMLAAVKPE